MLTLNETIAKLEALRVWQAVMTPNGGHGDDQGNVQLVSHDGGAGR